MQQPPCSAAADGARIGARLFHQLQEQFIPKLWALETLHSRAKQSSLRSGRQEHMLCLSLSGQS